LFWDSDAAPFSLVSFAVRSLLPCFALVLLTAPAFAAQVVVTEVTYTHSATTTSDSHLRVNPLPGTPANWRVPVDYASGTAVVRLEVFTKPTTTATRFQICFEATPNYACTDQAPSYTAPGVYTWTTQFTNFYQYSLVDWTKGTNKVALILKDTMNGKPAPENVGAATSALYMPTNLRVTVTLVSPGGTYVPPGPTDAGVVDAGVADAGKPDAGGSIDAGILDAGSSTDAGTIADAGMIADAGAIAPDAGTVGDAGVSDAGSVLADGGAQVPGEDPKGCGCDGSGGGLMLLATALLLRRRKR
jgi:hypothetical protein